jgi:AcrR family transcriptional regulator
MNPKETREQAVREAKCNLILDAAKEVFAQVGFHAARLEDIAGKAGFSKGSLYNYYESKEAIFLNLAIREYRQLLDRLSSEVDAKFPLRDALRGAMKAVFEVFGQHFSLLMEISEFRRLGVPGLAELMKSHQELLGVFKEFVGEMRVFLARIFAAARERGEIDSRVTDEELATFFGAHMRGLIFEWKIAGTMGNVEKQIESTIEFILYGAVGKRSPRGED